MHVQRRVALVLVLATVTMTCGVQAFFDFGFGDNGEEYAALAFGMNRSILACSYLSEPTNCFFECINKAQTLNISYCCVGNPGMSPYFGLFNWNCQQCNNQPPAQRAACRSTNCFRR